MIVSFHKNRDRKFDESRGAGRGQAKWSQRPIGGMDQFASCFKWHSPPISVGWGENADELPISCLTPHQFDAVVSGL
jgi:hypothetical protein